MTNEMVITLMTALAFRRYQLIEHWIEATKLNGPDAFWANELRLLNDAMNGLVALRNQLL